MRSPKKDSSEREIISKTAKAVDKSYNETEDVIDFFNRTISQNIKQDFPVDIHIDYIGSFKFNHRKAEIVKAHGEAKKRTG